MRTTPVVLLTASLLGVLVITYFARGFFIYHSPIVTASSAKESIIHSSHLFDKAFFSQAYEEGKKYKVVENKQIFGGILPHHLLAAPLIAGFFEGIENQKIDTVILLSPNHHGVGPYNIATSKGVWTTVFGSLQTDTVKVARLEKDRAAFVSEDLFDTEHGIYGITPFIKKTFPDALVVPIVIKGGTPREEGERLAQSLRAITDPQTIVIVSSDFSHYLPSDEADVHDQKTIPLIESFNTDGVFGFDHVKDSDSPESIYTLLKVMELDGATTSHLIANTNSAKLTRQPSLSSTTSYVTMYFSEAENKQSATNVFDYIDPSSVQKDSNPEHYTLLATGDVMLARSVNAKLISLKNVFYPFEKTAEFLKTADAVFINLESPLVPGCQPTQEGMIFCGDPKNAEGLRDAGISVANIANNHVGNHGYPGVQSTLAALSQSNLKASGSGPPAIITIRDKRFGFLGYNSIGSKEQGIAWADIPTLQHDIAVLKKNVDFVVVQFHWGVEYTTSPTTTQIELAHAAVDAGADLIIGNHPHWVQGTERYKGKLITYSHGNFVFDQMWSEETREGIVGRYIFSKDGEVSASFFPVIIDNYSQPRFATKNEAEGVLRRMETSSAEIARHTTSE